jgi:diguanylate cyclase
MRETGYTESPEVSRHLLKRAVPLMTRQKAALHPVSYAVWYEYVAGINPALNRELDTLTTNDARIDDDQTLWLYQRHILGGDADRSAALHDQLRDMLNRVDSSATEVGRRASAYGTELADWGQALASLDSPQGAASGLQRMLDRTIDMQSAVTLLKERLAESRQEAAELRAELSKTRNESLLDPLTGLANRRGFDLALARSLQIASRTGPGLSVAIADLDHFKRINDDFGHLTGDLVLQTVGQLLRANVKGKDTAARFGGEEFVLLMPDTPLDGARALAEQIRTAVGDCVFERPEGNDPVRGLTISIGITRLHTHDTAASFLGRADEALYVSKRRGRNCVTVLQ